MKRATERSARAAGTAQLNFLGTWLLVSSKSFPHKKQLATLHELCN